VIPAISYAAAEAAQYNIQLTKHPSVGTFEARDKAERS
jgi:hypothetical protein